MTSGLAAWFGMSVLAEVGTSIALFLRLRGVGVEVSWFKYGFPGYLESRYVDWRRSSGRSARFFVAFRVATITNLLVAAIAFIASSR